MIWNTKDILYIVGFVLMWGVSAITSYFKVDKRVSANEEKIKLNSENIKNLEINIKNNEDRMEGKIDQLINSFNDFKSDFNEKIVELKFGKQDK